MENANDSQVLQDEPQSTAPVQRELHDASSNHPYREWMASVAYPHPYCDAFSSSFGIGLDPALA